MKALRRERELLAAFRQRMVIPGSGHYCLEEAPEEVLAALTAFLAPLLGRLTRGAQPQEA